MPEHPIGECGDFGMLRFPLPKAHPILDDEEALEAALLQDALGSIESRISLPLSPFQVFVKDVRESASRILQAGASRLFPDEPDFALQEKAVRESDARASESETEASASQDRGVPVENQPDLRKGNDPLGETR